MQCLSKYSGNEIVLNEARAGKGEQLRAGKPRKEDEVAEDKHSVNREEFRGRIRDNGDGH